VTSRLRAFTLLVILITGQACLCFAQEVPTGPQLSVPLLEGRPAPFTGLLISEAAAGECIEDAAEVDRLRVETRVRLRELEVSAQLYEEFVGEQRSRITALSQYSWWDENGALFSLGVGLVLGVVVSLVVFALAQ